MSLSTFYFSSIVGTKVSFDNQKAVGKLKDLIVDINEVRPKVTAVIVKFGRQSIAIDFKHFTIEREGRRFKINCARIEDFVVQKHETIYLSRHLLDKQIVDINGQKVVRVNDLRMAFLSTGIFVVAVDVGLEGLLRRLGILRPIKEIMRVLKLSVPSYLILWDEVAAIGQANSGIRLSKEREKLSALHPSDLADILEDLDRKTQVAVFSTLDEENAADVLEELDSEAQLNVIENLSPGKAADVLEKMPVDEAADILDDLHEEKADELLSEMGHEAAKDIRELMGYEEGTVGSLMSTEFLGFDAEQTCEQVLAKLRAEKPEARRISYLYILDDDKHLIAIAPLSEVAVASPQTKLSDIMFKNLIKVYDRDPIDELAPILSKYNLLAIPVVDRAEKMLGIVIIEDVMQVILGQGREKPEQRAD